MRQWIALGVLIGLLLAIIGVRWLMSPRRLRGLAEAYLQSFFNTPVAVDSVRVSLFEGITVIGVTVADATVQDDPLLRCDEVWLRHDPLHLLIGKFKIDEIVATRPVCRARFDEVTASFTLQQALRLPTRPADREQAMPATLRMQEAHVLFYRGEQPSAPLVEEITLTLQGVPDPSSPDAYNLSWVAHTEERSFGALLIDFKKGTARHVTGGTPWLSLEAAMMAAAAAEPTARHWIELLGLRGHFRIVDFTLALQPAMTAENAVVLELDDANLSVPLDAEERVLPPEDRYLRLHGVTGRIRVDRAGALAELAGRLDETACTARMRLYGDITRDATLADVGFELEVSVADYRLPRLDADAAPREARFIDRWQKLRRFYRDFDPHGRIDATAELRKSAGGAGSIELRRALVRARGGDVFIRFFPYQVADLHGDVEITPDGVMLNGLTGRHGDGEIIAHGWISALRRASAVELDLWGDTIPLDDALCSALPAQFQDAWRHFDLGGHADLHVTMHRPAGISDPAPWVTTVEAELLDAQATFDGFAYPLTRLDGAIGIVGDTISIDGVQGWGGEADVSLAGSARLVERRLADLDLRIAAQNVAVDERLLVALPDNAQREVRALDPSGTVDLTARLTHAAASDRMDYAVEAELQGIGLRPASLPIALAEVHGTVDIAPAGVELHNISGRGAGGTITADGQVVPTPTGRRAEIEVHAQRISLTAALRDALPERLRAVLAPWRIEGPFDLATVVTLSAAAGETATALGDLRVDLAGAVVTHVAWPYPFTVLDGELIGGDGELRLEGVVADGEALRLRLDGCLSFSDAVDAGELTFEVSNLAFTETLRNALPWRWRRQWNNLDPGGMCQVRDGCLRYLRRGDGIGEWTLSGALVLANLSLRLGVPLAEATGRIWLAGHAIGGLAEINLSGTATLDRARIGRFLLEDVTADVQYTSGAQRWRGDNIRATLYGGAVRGAADLVARREGGAYELNAGFQRVQVSGLVADDRPPPDQKAETPIPGFADGRFFLTSADGDISTRRGGGRIRVRETELYRLPFLLNILHVISLSLPEPSAFQEASADFYIVGDELRLENIALRGGALALIGDGVMSLSRNELNLRLIVVSPHRWAQIPFLTELLEGAAREIVEVVVTGTLQEPQATARPLRGVERAVNSLRGTSAKAGE